MDIYLAPDEQSVSLADEITLCYLNSLCLLAASLLMVLTICLFQLLPITQ